MTGAILVTGAEGFVGKHLLEALLARGYDVQTHARKDGDISRCQLPHRNVGHVFHLAAKAFVPDSWTDPRGFYETNVLGTANILEFCRRSNATLTLVSSYVYGPPQALPISESHPLRPFNPYSHSKIMAEQMAVYYHEQFGVQSVVVRPFNLYGPAQPDRFLIPTLIRQAISPDCECICIEDPRPRRDFLYIDDFVDLLLRTVERRSFEIYNAGSGDSTAIQELVTAIAAITGATKPVRATGVVRRIEVMDVVADISKARRVLNWAPKTRLDEGLKRTIGHMAGARKAETGRERD